MRGKRSKQYRKLMEQYEMHYGFRKPYQVIVDSDMITETTRLKMDMNVLLKKTLHGDIKPLITQCSIRHLYAHNTDPGMAPIIAKAKEIERRFCGHHPDAHPEPLPTGECLMSVIDGKNTGRNKHRYVVATQDAELRRRLRQIPGVPLIYVNRGVMIMEPMASATEGELAKEERGKFRAELRGATKRKREDDGAEAEAKKDGAEKEGEEGEGEGAEKTAEQPAKKKKKKNYGKAKGPNPLAMKKKKKPAGQ
ncbi:related to UTP23 Essential nucleolar protein that is a component of the SSU (small subunit) processome involved in 40S ribosomal subunit biogenesis [Cephalotrichum gorgonifer]|uniref:U three protein 23 n=1 Tax=Cephalotrichum gorgonifer TaxID=2041049 RepID=A0AAE8SR10_9PEZI|nr:related to UTP23 Essential nucleolar protein that is a component of the SSU (small subunit) processome involved in 40S ribosomal subunit biogenesis [Cephalotrichum gorgonifer]